MMTYHQILDFWKKQNITNANELSAVLDSYSVNFAYHSGNIENSEITYHDTREVFDNNGVTSYTGSTKTLFEIQNAKAAYEKILSIFDNKPAISEQLLKEVHEIMTVGTYDEGATAEDVHEEISELLEELTNVDDKNALTAAAYFHAKFENIHPFSDGNGRVGRLLMNYFLLIHNHPPVVIFTEDKKDYYSALEKFDEALDLQPLVEFIKSQIVKTWNNHIGNDKNSTSLNDYI